LSALPGIEDFLEDSPASVFDPIVRRGGAALGGPVAVLLLDHLDLMDFYLTDAHPVRPELSKQLPLRVEEGHLRRVLRDREVVHAPAAEWQVRPLEAPYLSAASVRLRDTVIGALFLAGEEAPTAETLEDLRRLGIKAGVTLSVAEQYTDTVEVRRRRATPSIAAELQSDQLPPRSMYTPEVQVVGGIEPVYDVGGDWFDYALDPDRLFVAVCDGVGRGLSAASISYVTLGAVRNARKRGCSLEEITELAHEALISSTTYEQFATLILASIDLRTLQMDLISAAHPAPIVVPPPGAGRPGVLCPSHVYPPLGAFEKGREYVSCRYELKPVSRLIFFSDGATERRGENGEQLGVEGLLEYVDEARGVGKMEFLRFLMRSIEGFGDSEVEDDVTIVGIDLPPFG
jgi:serine phosphatase RsbU (regulator of sigma subunit)